VESIAIAPHCEISTSGIKAPVAVSIFPQRH
jgi:hypothetical protein